MSGFSGISFVRESRFRDASEATVHQCPLDDHSDGRINLMDGFEDQACAITQPCWHVVATHWALILMREVAMLHDG